MNCRICDASRHSILGKSRDWLAAAGSARDERAKIATLIPGLEWDPTFDICRCGDCGFVWIDPMPGRAVLESFYKRYYGTGGYAAKEEKKLRRFGRRIARLRRRTAGESFIDVGCNLGFAVEAARRAGFEATGIDVDEHTVAQAANRFPQAQFQTSTIEDFANTGSQYDFVHSSEVIEHVVDVQSFARSLSLLVKAGGLLYLTTPDAGHRRVPREFIRWPEVKPPEHICWFTRRSIRHLLESVGFEVLNIALTLKPKLKVTARKSRRAASTP